MKVAHKTCSFLFSRCVVERERRTGYRASETRNTRAAIEGTHLSLEIVQCFSLPHGELSPN
jgi:hypothetical protein